MPIEVVLRRDSNEPPVWTDANGDHVLVEAFPKPYASVEALFDDVAEAIVNVQLEANVRVLPQHRFQFRPDNPIQSVVRQGDPHIPGWSVAK
jgi:hypothetical protein